MKILAVDWGKKRLGFAVSDETATIAFPHGVASCSGARAMRRVVLEKLKETGAGMLVVGLPLTLRGLEGESAREARVLFHSLEGACGVPVKMWDERMTTEIALQAARECGAGKRGGKRMERIDGLAASVLLQSYLDFRKKCESEGGST
jgi:putative Holliday junction resolvase